MTFEREPARSKDREQSRAECKEWTRWPLLSRVHHCSNARSSTHQAWLDLPILLDRCPWLAGIQPRAEREDEPRAPLIRCLVELVLLPAGPDFLSLALCCPAVSCRPQAWPSFLHHHEILRGNSALGPPMEPWPTVVFPKQAGGIVRAGRGTAQPVLPLGVITRQFVSYRRKSAKLRGAGWASSTDSTHHCRSDSRLCSTIQWILYTI